MGEPGDGKIAVIGLDNLNRILTGGQVASAIQGWNIFFTFHKSVI